MISFSNPSESHGRLTLEEAAVLAGVKEKYVRKTLGSFMRRPSKKHGRRRFGVRDVVAFRLLGSVPLRLDQKTTSDVLKILSGNLSESGAWVRQGKMLVLRGKVPVAIPIADVEQESARRLRAFRECVRRVAVDRDILGGEPVFAGTRIPVRHVGTLVLRGEPAERLREEFPRLTPDQIEFAAWFTQLGPPPGRPRKKLRLRREVRR